MSREHLVRTPSNSVHYGSLSDYDGRSSEESSLTGKYTRQEERILTRKLDLHILPVCGNFHPAYSRRPLTYSIPIVLVYLCCMVWHSSIGSGVRVEDDMRAADNILQIKHR
jgi:hypothetical protein